MTFAEADASARKVAGFYHGLSVARGDWVGVLMAKRLVAKLQSLGYHL